MDSPEFISLLNQNEDVADFANSNMTVYQSDPAAILYSSGTTGKVKGVLLSHLNVIAIIAGYYHVTEETDPNEGPPPHPVSFFTLPMFHVFGFFMLVRAASKGETLVFMERFDFEKMLKAVENYRVTYMPVSPPLIVAFINSKLTDKYDLSSLQLLGCGGAPLGKEVTLKFKEKFPNVEIRQVRQLVGVWESFFTWGNEILFLMLLHKPLQWYSIITVFLMLVSSYIALRCCHLLELYWSQNQLILIVK